MRGQLATKNALVTVVMRIAEQVLAFVSRTIFIALLSAEYLGVTSLCANVLNVLSVAELGFGTAIYTALYLPVAKQDKEKIKSLMRLYRIAYSAIGAVVLSIGLILMPFLPYLIKGTTDLANIRIVYLICLAKTVMTYFLFAYKNTLLGADQRGYISSYITYLMACVCKILQCAVLFVLRKTPEKALYAYCLMDLLTTIFTNLLVCYVVNRRYPYLLEKEVTPLAKEEKKDLFKNVYGVALYKLSSTLNTSADSIIISSFLGAVILGIYSNYLLLANAVITIITMIFNSVTASVGNLNALETPERKRFIFNCFHIMYTWVFGFCIICLWVLLNPFVQTVWIGPDYAMSELIVFVMCMNYLVDGVMGAPIMFRNACGLFYQSRYRALATVVINVVLSIFFAAVLKWGIAGILFATIISRLTVTLWVDSYLVHKLVLFVPMKPYIIKYFISLFMVIATGGAIKLICLKLPVISMPAFIIRMVLCVTLPNIVWYLIYRKTEEFAYLKSLVKNALNGIGRKVSFGRRAKKA